MTRADAAGVRLRVVWVASRNGGPHGRVVVQRVVVPGTPGGDTRSADFWLSGPMPAAALVGATRVAGPAAWHELLLGSPVGDLRAPVPLRPAGRADLEELSEELAGSDAVAVAQRPLLFATAELVAGAPVSARVVRFAGDVLAHAFDGVLEGPLPGLVLGKTTVEGTAAAAQEPGARSAVDAWIPLADLAPARPAEGRGRVTTVLLEPPAGAGAADAPLLDGVRAAPLTAPGVGEHVAAVVAHPEDGNAREALAEALAGAGWSVRTGTSSIDVGGAGVNGVVDLHEGLLVLVERDLRRPGGSERVTLVGPSRAASGLLRSHGRLAGALAGHLAPPPDERGAAARIGRRRELRAAMLEVAAG